MGREMVERSLKDAEVGLASKRTRISTAGRLLCLLLSNEVIGSKRLDIRPLQRELIEACLTELGEIPRMEHIRR